MTLVYHILGQYLITYIQEEGKIIVFRSDFKI